MSGIRKRILKELPTIESILDLKRHGGVSDVLIGLKFADNFVHIHYPANEETKVAILNVAMARLNKMKGQEVKNG